MLQAGDLPYLLDVAGLFFRAMVDPERVAVRVTNGGLSRDRRTSRASLRSVLTTPSTSHSPFMS